MAIVRIVAVRPGVSRQELSGLLGIGKAAISKCVESLISGGVLEEAPSPVPARGNGRGRPAVALRVRPGLFYTIGVSFDHATGVDVVLTDGAGAVIGNRKCEVPFGSDPAEKCAAVTMLARELCREHEIAPEMVCGLGVSTSGILRTDSGEILSSYQFSPHRNVKLRRLLSNAPGGNHLSLINRSHLLGVIEQRWGAARGMRDFLYLDNGLGLAIYANGALVRGFQGCAGEAGYMQLNENGQPDIDGRRGTLNRLVGTEFHLIPENIARVVADGGFCRVGTFLAPGTSKITLDAVVRAAVAGDRLCSQFIRESFEIVGRAAVNLAYLFNPQAIFLPPWTAACPEVTVDVVKRMLGHYGIVNWELATDVFTARCGEEHLAPGAALLPVLEMLGIDPSFNCPAG